MICDLRPSVRSSVTARARAHTHTHTHTQCEPTNTHTHTHTHGPTLSVTDTGIHRKTTVFIVSTVFEYSIEDRGIIIGIAYKRSCEKLNTNAFD